MQGINKSGVNHFPFSALKSTGLWEGLLFSGNPDSVRCYWFINRKFVKWISILDYYAAFRRSHMSRNKTYCMNKIIIAFLFACIAAQASSQTTDFKVGVFDMDIMVQVMPDYRSQVDSVLQDYIEDSLAQEYNFYQAEYARVDSGYKADSVAKIASSVLAIKAKQRQELAYDIMNFQQIAEQRIQIKRAYLARPLYEKVMAAYKRVLDTQKYHLVLKPNAYEQFSKVDNIFIRVAKELNVGLPRELSELK
jgi:Skp family chaperone for outer membrane proteins